jgi:hypothetical protein
MTRRDFLSFSAGIAATVVLRGVYQWGLSVPMETDIHSDISTEPGNPGWLERRNPDRPAFISPTDKGQKSYLVYMAEHDPILRATHKNAYHDLFYNSPPKKISLRQSFWRHIEYAYNQLKRTNANLGDVVHTAMYSFNSVNSNYYTVGEVWQNFTEWDVFHPESETGYIDIRNYSNNVADAVPEYLSPGADKMMHFAGFAFLTYQSWYAQTHALPDADRVPNFSRLVRLLDENPQTDAQVFSGLGEVAWEFDETRSWIGEMITKKSWMPPRKGLLEIPGVVYDALASCSGIRFAAMLTKPNLSYNELESACEALDSPESLLPEVSVKIPFLNLKTEVR